MSRSRRLVVRALLWVLGALLALLSLASIAIAITRWSAANDRIRWGEEAITELSSASPEALRAKRQTATLDQNWITDSALYTADGQVLLYKSRHGRSFVVDHLFLARSSDGRWFHSSYHFCNGLNMIRADEMPTSIEDFCRRYFVQEFAPGSDSWWQATWSP